MGKSGPVEVRASNFQDPALLIICKIGLIYLGACFTVPVLLLFSCFGNFSGLVLISL